MFNLNLVHPERGNVEFERFTFPDGQPHIKILTEIPGDSEINVIARITTPAELFEVVNLPDGLWNAIRVNLIVTYLMGARMDRRINENQPCTLDTVAEIINNRERFSSVRILDPHSYASLCLIEESKAIESAPLVKEAIYRIKPDCLVSPDLGATAKVKDYSKRFDLPLIRCGKHRDSETGQLDGFVIVNGDVKDKTCLIVDDICDGGGTFTGLAQELYKAGAKSVNLVVTHGIFSKGYDIPGIEKIYTTDSYKDYYYTPPENIMVFHVEDLWNF